MLPDLVRVEEFLTAWFPMLLLACSVLVMVATNRHDVPIVAEFAEKSGWKSPQISKELMGPGWLSGLLLGRRRENAYIVTYRTSDGRLRLARCVVTEHDGVVVLSDNVVPGVPIR